ncbi:alpha/beta fold hydrolase [Terribacillus sp. DMT04]|uniref:alpha/beta fold hydrolase n=1 Tax=Terribacillus sp. DMT04 TaxID=2850441 RepID=UPI001C2C2BBE|nr:alpha/beta hydrolase [Terribacillus sp. DMT04]QXE02729.1 alpha/beta hydrolase [Terribacillus sp. DMT04]
MKQRYIESDGLRLAYLDNGVESDHVLVLMHGLFARASLYIPFMERTKNWRIIAPDLRGHGKSDHAGALADYDRAAYLHDLEILLNAIGPAKQLVLLGHSLSAVTAYQFAAAHPARINGLIIEDMGHKVSGELSYAMTFQEPAPTLTALCQSIEQAQDENHYLYYAESAYEAEDGWRLCFDNKGIQASQDYLNGDYTTTFQQVSCPLLLMRGAHSPILSEEVWKEMQQLHPHAEAEQFEKCGHSIHFEDLDSFTASVHQFLNKWNA